MAVVSRPSPEEILQGIIETLGAAVLPHLPTPYSQSEAGIAIGMLDYLKQHWNTAAKDLVEEIAGLESVLLDAAQPLRDAGQAGLGQRLERLAGDRTDDLAISALGARADALQAAALELFLLLERLENPAPALTALRSRVLREWQAYVNRRLSPGLMDFG